MADPADPTFHDPRMRGFRSRASVESVLNLIEERVARLDSESVPLTEASGRVSASEVVSGVDVPGFDRSAMDGYAVRGEETFGADVYSPIPFRIVGRVRPGKSAPLVVGPGEAAEIATGAPLPEGADSVVRVESTSVIGSTVEIIEPTSPGRHVGARGEDIARGAIVIGSGRALRPQDLGVLASIGSASVVVVRRPDVTILVTGDELVRAGLPLLPGRIADANSPMLTALVARDGGLPRVVGPLPDDRAALRDAIEQAARSSDAVLISGGSSTGPEDHAPSLLAELGELLVHGVAIRPASPAGLGWMGRVPVVLLPGNPVSCLCAYDFFAGPVVRRLGGRPPGWPYRPVEVKLGGKLASVVGRVDYARVRLVEGKAEPMAIAGASILSSTTRADGFVVVPADLEGYPAGGSVTVWLYE